MKVTTHLLSEVWVQLDQREWKYAVDKWKKTDEEKLVQGHWTSFTHRHSMKFKLYLAKWRENMLGQWFYTERFLTLNFDTKNWCKVTTNPLLTLYGWILSLTCRREGKIPVTQQKWNKRQTDRQIDQNNTPRINVLHYSMLQVWWRWTFKDWFISLKCKHSCIYING